MTWGWTGETQNVRTWKFLRPLLGCPTLVRSLSFKVLAYKFVSSSFIAGTESVSHILLMINFYNICILDPLRFVVLCARHYSTSGGTI